MTPRVPLPFPAGRRPLVGVVHLPPLPGSPGWAAAGRPSLDRIVEAARADARGFLAAGFDGLIVENYGDAPFFRGALPAESVAALALCARAVVDVARERAVDVARERDGGGPGAPVGVNALRNDARAALAVAVAAGARFVRVNVLAGAAVTDQGLIEGEAAHVLRLRDALGAGPTGPAPVALLADVHVKHARPLGEEALEDAARDLAERALADALIVTGRATGAAPAADALERVRQAAPGLPVWLGSGLDPANCAALAPRLDGAIAASAAREGGRAGRPLDPARARALAQAFALASAQAGAGAAQPLAPPDAPIAVRRPPTPRPPADPAPSEWPSGAALFDDLPSL